MKQSYLPDELQEVTIRDLLPWENGYVVPWAMRADERGALWIDASFSFSKNPFGTATMKITKGDNGHIIVFKDTIKRKYTKTPIINSVGIVGAGNDFMPVVLEG